MNRLFKYNLFLTVVIILITGCGGGSSGKQAPAPAFDYLNRKIDSWIQNGYYDGAAVRIVKDKDILFESYYGGYTDTTALHVASAGKWIAAATIAAIVDEGKLSWDDEVRKYLPEFSDIKGDATLSQLMSHTAGYTDYQPEGKRRDDYQTLKEAVDNILNLPADTIAGTKFQYGGLAMQVAGRMAEVATGKDWETLFQEKIAKPLDMKYSYFVPVSEEPGFNPMLGGGFKTCLHDYMNFLNMVAHNGLFEEKRILSEKAVDEIEADHVKNATIASENYVLRSRQNLHNGIYGLGCWREEIDENNKTTLISSPGWAGTYPWVDRKNNVYGFVLAKVKGKAFGEGFSSFYGSAVLPLIVRDAIKQSNYPKELKKSMINIGQARLYCEELGAGEPVIFIHGHSLNRDMWDLQFFEFAKNYRAIRYDIRGYGCSSPQKEGEQFTHAEDLRALMDSLKISKAHIIGLSLGGYIGADMLGWFPERIESAVLASGNIRPLPKPSIPIDEIESEQRDMEIAALKKKGIDAMKREWFSGLIKSGGTNKEQMRHPLWSMIYQWDAWQPLHKEARVIAGGDAYDKLKLNKPTIPVLIVEGQSENNSYSDSPDILNYLPNGQLIVLENCGHMLNMEQPDIFNNAITEFYRTIK
ncbi:alpha/beta fold hydrolase [Dysgonomonas sp. BGC7]|uniref:alpha/beta fold hydrolase n=1 Tax=Dysgonomonas sp. BGC7 TaxID=1658008 RepID=UPI0009E3093C|nr:alpha/beta fold hydrolase [Dysgonomonas sp. BGC7]MBD8388951.1 class A beta-lactamase-related serine hydrolase [Dysgonomonas sp. BGC7]